MAYIALVPQGGPINEVSLYENFTAKPSNFDQLKYCEDKNPLHPLHLLMAILLLWLNCH